MNARPVPRDKVCDSVSTSPNYGGPTNALSLNGDRACRERPVTRRVRRARLGRSGGSRLMDSRHKHGRLEEIADIMRFLISIGDMLKWMIIQV